MQDPNAACWVFIMRVEVEERASRLRQLNGPTPPAAKVTAIRLIHPPDMDRQGGLRHVLRLGCGGKAACRCDRMKSRQESFVY